MLERIYRKASKKVMALLLAVCMVISMSPPMMAAAVTDSGEPVVFSGFASLPEEVRLQNVALGVSLADLVLPDTLEAYLAEPHFDGEAQVPPAECEPENTENSGTPPKSSADPENAPPESSTAESVPDAPPSESSEPTVGESADEQTQTSPDEPAATEDTPNADEPTTQVLSAYVEGDVSVTIEGVTWESAPAYDGDTKGKYLFTAVLPNGYTVEEGVSLPKITVVVGQAGQLAADKVIAMIDALPTMDEWTTMDDAAARAVMNEILAAKKAYDALTAEEQAQIDEAQTQKLTELADAAAALTPAPLGDDTYSGTYGGCDWSIVNRGEDLTITKSASGDGILGNPETEPVPWKTSQFQFLCSVTIGEGVKTGENAGGLFNLTYIDTITGLNNLDTSRATNMKDMFSGCNYLESLDVSSFDTSEVTDMSGMFGACQTLTELNVSNFDTSKVKNMSWMFGSSISLETLNISNWDTGSVEDMSAMFYNCEKLSTFIGLENLNTQEVTTMRSMFEGCANLPAIDYSNWSNSKVTEMSRMFANYSSNTPLDLSSLKHGSDVRMDEMFIGYKSSAPLDLSKLNTNGVSNINNMFRKYASDAPLDVSKLDLSTITDMSYLFSDGNFTALDLCGLDMSGVQSSNNMFSGCTKLKSVIFPQATQLKRSFQGCTALESLTLGAEPPDAGDSNPFDSFTNKEGLVLAKPDGTPLTDDALAAAMAKYRTVDDGSITDTQWYGWRLAIATTPEDTPNIAIDYANEKLTGFVSGGSYTVNGTEVSPAADGTLAIPAGWFYSTVSIIKKASDVAYSDSAAQSLAIPSRPVAPTTPGKADETVVGSNDGKLTGLTANTPYQLSTDRGTTWTTKTADSTGAIISLAPGSYLVRFPATTTSFASKSTTTPVIIGSGSKPDISAKLTVTIDGWGYGDTAKTPTTAASGATIDQSNLTYTYSGTANDGTTLTSSTTAPTKTGSYTVTAKYEDDTQKGTVTSASFTVAKAPLTLTGGTVTTRGYVAGDTTATVTAVTFGGLKNGETLAITTDYTVTNAEFADANAGTNKPVTATVALASSTKATNYTLSGAALNTTGTITKIEDGTQNPDYAAAKAALDAVHIITNVTPTLGDVTLPTGWSFTGDPATRLAGIEGQANQNFAVKYTSQNPDYPDVALLAQAFPVTTVLMDVQSGLSMVTLNKDEVKDIAPVTVAVKGAPLPNSGDYAESNIGLFSALPKIATISGNVGANQGAVNVTGVAKGLTMVGIAYKNTPTMMLGYILIQVNDPAASSQNNIEEIKDIGDTLERLIADPTQPTAVEQATVNAVASEITKLPDTAKAQLTVDDVKKIDALQQTVQNITVTPALPVVSGAPTLASNFTVVGAAVSSGAAANDTVTITATPKPVSGEIKMELDLAMTVGGGEQQLKSPLFFEMELPAGIDPAKLKISHILAGGSTEEVTFTASGQTVSFKLDSFSGLQFIVSGGGSGGGQTGGGGSGGSSSDDGYDFWMEVKDKVQKADDGDVIKANAKDNDKMPASVMDALRKNDSVSLVITWNGKTITIPAGKAQKNEPGRIYWPLSKLAELYAGIAEDTVLKLEPQNPETGGPGKYIPITGGGELITLEAPASAARNNLPGSTENAQVITPAQPKAITPPDAGFEADAFAGTQDNPKAKGSVNIVLIVLLLLLIVASAVGGVWYWKRRTAKLS